MSVLRTRSWRPVAVAGLTVPPLLLLAQAWLNSQQGPQFGNVSDLQARAEGRGLYCRSDWQDGRVDKPLSLGGGQTRRRLHGDRQNLGQRQRPLAIKTLLQGRPGHVLHDQKRLWAVAFNGMNGHDMIVADRRLSLGLAGEPLACRSVGRKLRFPGRRYDPYAPAAVASNGLLQAALLECLLTGP
jgi:hypothetical protein